MRVDSMARLSDYDCIGFDLDHTLIQYKLGNFYPFIYKTFAQALVKEKGYDPCLLEDSFEDLKDFCLRGLILDTKKGNILKLHKNGFILRATHGTTQMTKEEVTECYGEKHIWPEIRSLRENPSQHSTTFRLFESYFDLPVLTICARIIDMIDKKSGKPDEYNFWPDIISLLRQIFNPFAFRDQNGYFFPIMVKDTAKYVKPCSRNIIDWIKALKAGGQKVFLLTNSYIDYTSLLMNYAVGEHWPELFDIILCMAGKPGFFESQEPLTNFHEVDGEKEVGTVQELKENKIYSRGNHKDFTTFLKQQTSKDNPKVLYFGDSMRSDLYPSKVYGNWDVVTVLEEMESEGIVEQHSVNHDEPHDSVEDGPRSKKPRCQMHDHIEIEKNKEEVLLSNQWGSFFTHDDAALNGVIKDCGQCINNIMDGFFVCKTTKERRQMNTFGGDVIQKYSTIAIPRIDFITELRLDHPFETFTSLSGGFYPGFPKSLHL